MKSYLNYIFAFLFISSCGNVVPKDEYDILKIDYDSVNFDLMSALTELEELKFGSSELYKRAELFLEQNDFSNAIVQGNLLLTKHPTSLEAGKINVIISKAEKAIALKEKEAKRMENEKIAKEKRRLSKATKKLKKRYDDMNEITWYTDKSSKGYGSKLYIYIGKRESGPPWLRMYIKYYADDWLFIEKYKIKVDGKTYTISEKEYGEIKTDNGSGSIWETLDRQVGAAEYAMVKDISDSKLTKIRYNGKDYYKDRIITSKEKQAIKNVLNAYEALGGKALN